MPWKSRNRSLREHDLVVSSLSKVKNFRQPAAILFSTSLVAGWWNVNFLPRYFCDLLCGRTSMLRSPICVCSGCGGLRRGWLCKIFVLSGWSSRPVSFASRWTSFNMFLTCVNDLLSSSTSSAKRRFVNCVLSSGPSCKPHPLRSHRGFSLRNIDSDKQLNSNELSASPCLVPRCILKTLLRQSVLTLAVWLV